MQYESLVYGCIIDTNDPSAERIKANKTAMMALPFAQEWPFLSQEMFSVPESVLASNSSYMVHFGATYHGIEYEWQSWISHFERLLQRMYWVSAKVHLDTVVSGTHVFTWESEDEYHKPGSSGIRVHCEWSKEGNV